MTSAGAVAGNILLRARATARNAELKLVKRAENFLRGWGMKNKTAAGVRVLAENPRVAMSLRFGDDFKG